MLTIFETCGDKDLLPGESHIRIGEYKSVMVDDRIDMGASRLWTVQELDFYEADLGFLGKQTLALAHLDFLPSKRESWFSTQEFSRCPGRNLCIAVDGGGNVIQWDIQNGLYWGGCGLFPLSGGNLIQWDVHNGPHNPMLGDHLSTWDYEKRSMANLPWEISSVANYFPTLASQATYYHISVCICEHSPLPASQLQEAIAAS
jgi:hypothetical protein